MLLSDGNDDDDDDDVDDVDDYGNDYNDGVGGDDHKDIGLSFFSCIVGTTMIMIMTMMILIVVVKNDDGCGGGGGGSGGVVYAAKKLVNLSYPCLLSSVTLPRLFLCFCFYQVRAVSSRALGALVRGMGEESFEDLLPWLMETLTSENSSVDRSGAAQGMYMVKRVIIRHTVPWLYHPLLCGKYTLVMDVMQGK